MKKTHSVGLLGLAITTGLMFGSQVAVAATAGAWDAASTTIGGDRIDIVAGSPTSVTVSFEAKQQARTMPAICDLLVGGSSPSSLFNGDLSAYTGLRFKITGDGHIPTTAKLILYKTIGSGDRALVREWHHADITVSSTPGDWMIDEVPLALDQGWTTEFDLTYFGSTLEYAWNGDLTDVDMMILRLEPSGMDAQAYSVDQFQLLGAGGPTAPAQLTSLQAYFGVNSIGELSTAQRNQDSDGDGMSDLNEILAGMDPNDASSVLAATLDLSAGNLVSWDGVVGTTYGILRSTDLTSGFELIQGGIVANITGPMSYEDPAPVAGKANYYKIVKY